jgi:hypothetical protein
MTKRKQRKYLNDGCLCGGSSSCTCLRLADEKQKIDWNYIQSILTGKNDPLTFPIAYPAIDLDPKTKNLIYTVSFVIAGSILAGALIKANKK